MLLYALQHSWLTPTAQKQIDGWQAHTLRMILGIKVSHYSHITNVEVLRQAKDIPLAAYLKASRLRYLGHVLRNDSHTSFAVVFNKRFGVPRQLAATRRVGKPSQHWGEEMLHEAEDSISTYNLTSSIPLPTRKYGRLSELQGLASNRRCWRAISRVPTRGLRNYLTPGSRSIERAAVVL